MKAPEAGFAAFWRRFETLITGEPSSATVFNQYRDRNPEVDLPDAPAIRKANLRNYLKRALGTAVVLVVGEAAGPWECRFSGIPFTSERQLIDPSFPVVGRRSSRDAPSRPTRILPPFTSLTAEIFWHVMLPYRAFFLAWNAFPLHPHQSGDALTVRKPTPGEVLRFSPALHFLAASLKPIQVLAIGRTAEGALERLGVAHQYVRHPSQGGKAAFAAGMEKIGKVSAAIAENAAAGGGKNRRRTDRTGWDHSLPFS